jgi:PAS domain S-box-containing protein
VSVPRAIPLTAVLSVVLPAAATLALGSFAPHAKWVHEPLHASLETGGGLIALAMAAVLMWRRQYQGQTVHLQWVATALVCMGLQDLAHAWLHVSPGFFWSRALPTLLGGLLITGVWLPADLLRDRAALRLPSVAGLLTLPLCAAYLLAPRAWPVPFLPDGSYALWARLINVAGGAGFFVSAAFFLRRYGRDRSGEDLVLANHGLLFGAAAVLFGFSHLWGAIWWLFHGLRLLAYLVVLFHVVRGYRGLQAAGEAALVRRLQQSEAQMRLVNDAIPVLVSFLTRDGRYAYVNRGYTDWFGIPADQLIGRYVRDVVGEAAFEEIREALDRASSGERVTFERRMPYRLGGTRYIRASYMPQRGASGDVEGVVTLISDITAEKRAQERAERLQAITSALSQALTPEDVARASLREAVESMGARAGTFYAVEAEGGALRLLHGLGLPEGVVTGFEVVPLDAPVPMASAVRSGVPEWLESPDEMIRRFPGMARAVKLSSNQSWAALPLLGRAGPLGVVLLGFQQPSPLDAESRAFLIAVCQQAAHAFERASLYRAAQAAVQVREDFLSVAGHELRTPLTSLKLQLELLSRGLPQGGREKLEPRLVSIGRQVGRLESLVRSLLDVGRLSAGRLELELSDVDLGALSREVVERLEDVFQQAGCEVRLEIADGVRGQWDAQRLDQVLVNLLTNAAKYGAGHPVEVRVERAGARARVTVSDRGIGIAPEVLPRIFGRFERGVSGQQYGGLGLGLYISRQLISAMAGEVRVESKPGEGATFILELPLS